MQLKNTFFVITSMLLIVLLQACTEDFEEINQNPTGLTAERFDEDLLFTRSLLYGALRYTEYQRAQQLYAQHYMQYYAISNPGFPTGRYITRNDWLTAYWTEAYADFGMQCQQVLNITEGESNKEVKRSIAKIWKVFLMHRITDFWGDVPYFEAFAGDLTPAYTPQQEIYLDMLEVLEQEAENLNASTATETFGVADVIYQGTKASWIKFANSLRLRLAMRLSEVDPGLAQTQVSSIIAANNLIDEQSASAFMPYGPDFGGALENIQPMSILKSFNEYRMSNTLIDFLQDNNDPRLALFATPNADSTFIGLQNGLNAEELSQRDLSTFAVDSDIISNQSAPTPLLLYGEVLFLKAEAALRGWSGGNASDLYAQGIAASINFWNDVYLDLKMTLPDEEANALPEIVITDSVINAYVMQPAITYSAANGLQQIHTQKWLALINQGFEAYAEYRRTGFPQLNPIPNTNGESETGGTELPRRIRYPVEEQALNREQYNAAITRQGADLPTTRMWWDAN